MSDLPDMNDNPFLQTLIAPAKPTDDYLLIKAFMDARNQPEAESQPIFRREGSADRPSIEIDAELDVCRQRYTAQLAERDRLIGQLAAVLGGDAREQKRLNDALSTLTHEHAAVKALIEGLQVDLVEARKRETFELMGGLAKERIAALIEQASAAEALYEAESRYAAAQQEVSRVAQALNNVTTQLNIQWGVHPTECHTALEQAAAQAASERDMDSGALAETERRANSRQRTQAQLVPRW